MGPISYNRYTYCMDAEVATYFFGEEKRSVDGRIGIYANSAVLQYEPRCQ